MVRKKAIGYYELLDPGLGMETKVREIQRHLREIQIAVRKDTIRSWIEDHEQKRKETQKWINLRFKERNRDETGQFDTAAQSCHDLFKAKSTG